MASSRQKSHQKPRQNSRRPPPKKKALAPKHDVKLCENLRAQEQAEFNFVSESGAPAPIDIVVGLDEVGVACLAGPVVAGCFAYLVRPLGALASSTTFETGWATLKPKRDIFVCDSKALGESERAESEKWLREISERPETPAFFATAEASVPEIDKINIYHACNLAMARAFETTWNLVKAAVGPEALTKARVQVLLDGNRVPRELRALGSRFKVDAVVRGDTKSFAVAAASIFAKNYRDDLMHRLATEFTGYGWESNVGYPTPKHKEAVKRLGVTDWHRRSFNLEF